ncbi:hypothetical protein M5689_006580 [Euphorbia peplus]|nr:hypothetical protein M5689_006580 [Euphorbia peplus]
MCSSVTHSPSLLLQKPSVVLLLRRRNLSLSSSPLFFVRSDNPRVVRLSASLSDNDPTLSWFSSPLPQSDACKGWAVVEPPPSPTKGFSVILISSAAFVGVFAAALAYFSLSTKVHGVVRPIIAQQDSIQLTDSNSGVSDENASISDTIGHSMPQPTRVPVPSVSTRKLEQVKISVLVDSTQFEALSVLKKLKIIEDDVRANELCTRREYARWLVRLHSLLERSPKHRIAPSQSLSGSVVAAFDDVGLEDPDFDYIQALAEAGFIPSKLSGNSCYSDCSKEDKSFCFHPERFISRQDLINWKAQLEYQFMPGIIEQMSRTKVDYMDVKEINSDASPELLVDMLAGEKSIIRKVFGKSRRFQPKKPLTKSQAAVALTSGRMAAAVHNEMLRLEAENSLRQTALKEIRCELLDKGDIERFWNEKMDEQRSYREEIQKLYITALHDLEQEKMVQEKTSAEFLKENAAMDCQKQLLQSLKREVDEMSERLESERAMYMSEQCSVQELLTELQTKQEGTLDTKSILEAEIEAIKILRSWIEDEARKSQARAKVLEEVGRRWKWDNQP